MSENVASREVQRRDDPFGIPACFYWTMDEVADWVESIGYGKYKENFRSHFINGRKLLTVDACVLPRMGITHFGDILDLAGSIRNLLCTGRSLTYRRPHIHSAFKDDCFYEFAPIDGLHPNYELSGRINILLGKAPQIESCSGPSSSSCRQFGQRDRPPVSSSSRGNDFNWRLWVPEYYQGYMPKDSPFTAKDFEEQWHDNQHVALNLLGRHMYNLLRPP